MIAKQVGQSQKIGMTKHREGELDSFPLTACFNSVEEQP